MIRQTIRYFQDLFFRPVSANGFGLMRILWASTALFFVLVKWNDVTWLYADNGLLPLEDLHIVTRTVDRFSVLDFVTKSESVFALYVLLIFCLICTIIGQWPRLMIIMSFLLLVSFHERNSLTLNGGDTVIRILGFLLMIAPETRAFSVTRLKDQWEHWKAKKQLLPSLTMSAWPYRLLTWQLVVLYVTSMWDKSYGSMWWEGTAVGSAIHHEHFMRFSRQMMDWLSAYSTPVSHFTLFWQFAWIFLLIPKSVLEKIRFFAKHSLKRMLIFGGILFHGGIFVTMNVGPFCWSMFSSYCGMLIDEDFDALRNWKNRNFKQKLVVLYDGHCRLCQRSVFTLAICDSLRRLELVDLHNNTLRTKYAKGKKKSDLMHEMHVRLPNGEFRAGFYAFRALCKHLPVLWPLRPFLFLPLVAPVGKLVYSRIAASRASCQDGACKL